MLVCRATNEGVTLDLGDGRFVRIDVIDAKPSRIRPGFTADDSVRIMRSAVVPLAWVQAKAAAIHAEAVAIAAR